jgi:glycosyltransferase involved in cell wall biosynthesis
MVNKLISVIMPCYNEPNNYFEAAVESVLNQTYKNFELIIIFDNPTNSELIKLGRLYTKKDNRVKSFVNEKNYEIVSNIKQRIGFS